MIPIVAIVLGCIVAVLLHYIFTRNANKLQRLGIPMVPGTTYLMGNISDVILGRLNLEEMIIKLYKSLEGHRFGVYMQFQTPVLLVRDPELVKNILVRDFSHFHDRSEDRLHDLIGDSMVFLKGEEWRSMRNKMAPLFSRGKLERMFNQIFTCSDEMVDYLATFPESQPLDVADLTCKYMLNVNASLVFGLKISSHKKAEEENSKMFIEECRRFFNPSMYQILKFCLRLSNPRLSNLFGLNMNDTAMSSFFKNLICDTIRYREKTGTRQNDFIQLCMDLRSGIKKHAPEEKVANDHHVKRDTRGDPINEELSDSMLAGQAFVFFSSGSMSTSATINFVLYQLATHLQVQDKVHHEIDNFLKHQDLTFEVVEKMKYLDNVCNETMRINTFGVALPRFCTKDYRIPGTDIILEKGTQINIPVIALHKDSKYFDNPEQFQPERFDKEIPKHLFLPFGDGPRTCIAFRQVNLIMKVFLAKLLAKFSVRLCAKTTIPARVACYSLLQQVKGGMWLQFERRKPLK